VLSSTDGFSRTDLPPCHVQPALALPSLLGAAALHTSPQAYTKPRYVSVNGFGVLLLGTRGGLWCVPRGQGLLLSVSGSLGSG
jgi:hypothetical protein